jgi:thioredoxin reductase
MSRTDLPRIAVLGAGPVGLEAALYARTLGLPVTIYERGRVAEHVHRWGHARLFSPFGMNSTPLGRDTILKANPNHDFPGHGDCITGREHLARYLEPLAQAEPLKSCLRLNTQVLHLARRGLLKEDDPGDPRRARMPFRLIVREGNNRERAEEADVVLDCTGTYGQHRWLGDGGIPAVGEMAAEQHIVYGLEDILGERRAVYAGKNVLVVGSGYSAATTVCALADVAEQHTDTWVLWLARGASTQPLKRIPGDSLRERDRLAMRANTLATRGEGNVEFHPQSFIETVECPGKDQGFNVTGRCGSKPCTWQVDRLIANVGYTPSTDLYRELQVHECYASLGPMKLAASLPGRRGEDCLKQTSPAADTLRNPEPGFFLLGAKSYGRNSNFLLRVGFEQIREVFSLVLGKPGLDLYKASKR